MHSLEVYFRPDNFPDWVLWKEYPSGSFTLIGKSSALGAGGIPSARAGFYPRQSFGKPPDTCDSQSTARRLRRGYQFQVRFKGTGHVVIDRFRLHAQKQVEKSRGGSV
jgi:hypothetical protein